MIEYKWGSEEQRLADNLIKEATNTKDITEAIILIKKAISIFDNQSFFIKLSNYLLKNQQTEEAVTVLLNKITEFKKLEFDYSAHPEMSISIFYSHLGTQMNKLKDSHSSIYYQTVSFLYLALAFSVQDRRTELFHLLEGAKSPYLNDQKFWKPFQNAGLDRNRFSKEFEAILSLLKPDLLIIIDRVKFLNQHSVAHEDQLMNDSLFWGTFQKLKLLDFEAMGASLTPVPFSPGFQPAAFYSR